MCACWIGGAIAHADPDTAADPQARRDDLRRLLPPSKRPHGALPDDAALVEKGAVIGEIYIETRDIFDLDEPGENRLAYRMANRLHATTNPAVIERQLLFASGDPYDPGRLRETERRLRGLKFLHDAEIVPIAYRDDRVDIVVITRDVWTLGLGAGFERSGGDNAFQANVEDGNLLGSGRSIEYKYSDGIDRSSTRFRFSDPAVFGSRAELRLWYADNSDGHRRVLDLSRPFFALDARWSAGGRWVSDRRLEKIYRRGEIVEFFAHRKSFVELRGGLSRGLVDQRTRRWLFGYTYDADRFALADPLDPIAEAGASPALAASRLDPVALPPERTLSYFWLGFEKIEDGFVEVRHMDQLGRTEDFNLGHEMRARVGWSSRILGGDGERAVFDLSSRWGWTIGERQTVLLRGHANGRWGREGGENVLLGGEVRYFRQVFGPHRLMAAARFDAGWQLDPERQLLLGGDNGLRGYPSRFQDGDRRFLISLEQRFYTDLELFRLIRVGAAAFCDIGRAWYDDAGSTSARSRTLSDVGVGLRLGSSRSSRGQMIHLDVAFPLAGDEREVQWLVTSRRTF